jgi:hypothetical protein
MASIFGFALNLNDIPTALINVLLFLVSQFSKTHFGMRW